MSLPIIFALFASATGQSSSSTITAGPSTTQGAVTQSNHLSYSHTYTPGSLPNTWQPGQAGTNNCGTGANATSLCQNVYINSINDFCLYGPPVKPGQTGELADDERIEVAYCLNAGYGTRVFPDGTILGAHWVQTPDYVQITGWGDFTKIGVPSGDQGGELDPHGADGNGNPIGGLVFGNSFGGLQQYHEWTNFMSANEFCIRACNPNGSNPAQFCNHVYDVMACEWNMPGNYDPGYFDSCQGDSGEPMGIYGTSTFHQGQPATPAAHPAPRSSDCVRVASVTSGSVEPTGYSFSTVFTTSGTLTEVESVATFTLSSSASASASASSASASSGSGSTGSKNGAASTTAPLWAMAGTLMGLVVGAVAAF